MKLSLIYFLAFSGFVCSQTLNSTGGFITAQAGSFIYVNGTVSNNASGILAVNGNGSATSAELYVTQDVVNNATINADGYIRLLGNWFDNAVFNSATGTVFFEGGNQFLGGSSPTLFYNVTLDGTGIKTQQVDKFANGVLDLKSLHLNTDVYGFYSLNPSVAAVVRTTGFVSSANGGFLSRTTNTVSAYLYPVGSTANTSANIPGTGTFRYRPVEITPVNNQTTQYSVRMANLDASNEAPVGYDRTIAEPTICSSNPLFYHQIDRVTGTTDASIRVFYDQATDGSWLNMARWNQTTPMWENMAGTSNLASAPLSSVAATNWTDFNDIPYILTKVGVAPPFINTPLGGGCSPQYISLSTTPMSGVSYAWEVNGVNIGSGETLNTSFTNEGCYDVTLTASDGNCTVSTSMVDLICVEQTPDASFVASPSSIDFSEATVSFINQSSGAVTYEWDFGNSTSSSTENPTVSYTDVDGNLVVMLVASTLNGCTDTAYQVIPYNNIPIYYVPNSFTPDADQHNPLWKPVFTSGFDPYNYDLYIFNRWGEIIWESHDASVGWDGTFGMNGTKCQDGVYTYVIGFKAINDDKKYELNGHITLVR